MKTRDLAEACRRRDEFLERVGFYALQDEQKEAAENRTKTPEKHYWDAVQSVDASVGYEQLIAIKTTLDGYIQDLSEGGATASTSQTMRRYEAQAAALGRVAAETINNPITMADAPHPFEITLQTAAKTHCEELRLEGKRPKTSDKVLVAAKRFASVIGQDRTLRSINAPLVRRYVLALRARGLGEATTANDLSFLGSAFERAQRDGYLSDQLKNPFRGQKFGGFAAPTKTATFDEPILQDILASSKSDPDLLAAIYMAWYTGMRISEIFACKLDTTASGLVWNVAPNGSGKTLASTRLIPVARKLKQALELLDYFPTVGFPIPWRTSSSDALGKRFGRLKRQVLKDHGISDDRAYVFHSFRHQFVTHLVGLGFSELLFVDLTGHAKSSVGLTEAGKTYAGRQALPKLVEMIEALPGLPSPSQI